MRNDVQANSLAEWIETARRALLNLREDLASEISTRVRQAPLLSAGASLAAGFLLGLVLSKQSQERLLVPVIGGVVHKQLERHRDQIDALIELVTSGELVRTLGRQHRPD